MISKIKNVWKNLFFADKICVKNEKIVILLIFLKIGNLALFELMTFAFIYSSFEFF